MPNYIGIYMALLYKNNGIWYIVVTHNGTKKYKSPKKFFHPQSVWEDSPFTVYIMIVIFGLGDWMIKKLEIVGIIFTATNVIGFFLIKGFYLPCLIGIWLMYSYYQSKKDS